MSEYINNREYRQKALKGIIRELHEGKTVDEVKPRFAAMFSGVSTSEIAEMEQSLIAEGMPVAEIQKLCDVHASVFNGSIEDIHMTQNAEEIPGHPVNTFKLENREIEKLIHGRIKPHLEEFKSAGDQAHTEDLKKDFSLLSQIGRHYSRKENLLFPFLEKYGITAPPKVMWGVDDEIRDAIKETKELIENPDGKREQLVSKAQETVKKILEMIHKEENILFTMALDTLSEDEWFRIEKDSREIGFCLMEPKGKWNPVRTNVEQKTKTEAGHSDQGYVKFDAGIMTSDELNAMLNTLPFDITFVDKDDTVRYFTQGKERIFARPKSIIGRKVGNCHPPASVHIVEKIVEDLKSGRKNHEDFWIKMGGKYVYIRYYAVRNEKGEYLGTMEVTQDIQPVQEITGEKRLATE